MLKTSALCLVASLILIGCESSEPFVRQAEHTVSVNCQSKVSIDGKGSYNLALSGGGYRAMLFHVGAIWRLHELGLLREVRAVSSVSGGSITAGVLALAFERIQNDPPRQSDCYRALVAAPLLQLAKTTIDWKASAVSLISPGAAGNTLAGYYEKNLFGPVKLSDLPSKPSFLFQATNLHTGSVWTFSKTIMGDSQVGYTPVGSTLLASGIAASSAFPPVLSPFVLNTANRDWNSRPTEEMVSFSREYVDRSGGRISGTQSSPASTLNIEWLRSNRILLTDGGVADNLGLEGIWHAKEDLLISDGGAFSAATLSPPTDWIGQLAHVTELIHTQPTQLRYHLIIDGFRKASLAGKDGAFWSLSKELPVHREECYFNAPRANQTVIARLASIPTRLSSLSDKEAKELINLGYHMADWNMPFLNKRMFVQIHSISGRLPFPDAPIWPLTEFNQRHTC